MIGPYQGDVLASGIIDFGKGVCGTGAATQETQIVADVTKCDVRRWRCKGQRLSVATPGVCVLPSHRDTCLM